MTYVNLFLGNGSIFSLGVCEHRFIGGMSRNLWGDIYPPHPPGFAPLVMNAYIWINIKQGAPCLTLLYTVEQVYPQCSPD